MASYLQHRQPQTQKSEEQKLNILSQLGVFTFSVHSQVTWISKLFWQPGTYHFLRQCQNFSPGNSIQFDPQSMTHFNLPFWNHKILVHCIMKVSVTDWLIGFGDPRKINSPKRESFARHCWPLFTALVWNPKHYVKKGATIVTVNTTVAMR
jgi:hypothetical protein